MSDKWKGEEEERKRYSLRDVAGAGTKVHGFT